MRESKNSQRGTSRQIRCDLFNEKTKHELRIFSFLGIFGGRHSNFTLEALFRVSSYHFCRSIKKMTIRNVSTYKGNLVSSYCLLIRMKKTIVADKLDFGPK